MFDELDETIRRLLITELPLVKNGNKVVIDFHQPTRDWSTRLGNTFTINVFLYDVRENNILRQPQWERLPGNGRDQRAHLKRGPLRLDYSYMITAWANDPEDEHILLRNCLLTLFRFPILPKDRLVGSLQNQPFDVQARLASHDHLTNPAEVWASLDNEMRPSVSYIITLALDPWQEVTEPLVHTLSLYTGQTISLPAELRLVEGTRSELEFIGGTVVDRSHGNIPMPAIEVAIKGTGLFTTTDQNGHFSLGSMPPGEYTLVAWLPQGKPQPKKIQVPTKEDNYDIELET